MKKGYRSKRIVLSGEEKPGVLVVEGQRVEAILPYNTEIQAKEIELVDFGDSAILPGLVDCHVHVNEPGRTEWEGYKTATQAAAAGGFTTIVDMPLNCIPVTTTRKAFEAKLTSTHGQLHVDCGFWGGVVPDNLEHLPGLLEAGVLGCKAFLINSGIEEFPQVTREHLLAAMPVLRNHNVPLLVHAELEGDSDVTQDMHSPSDYRHYLASRPLAWEDRAISMMIDLAKETQCAVHIVHLSSASALPLLRQAKNSGLPITAETCPHYLCLAAEDIAPGDTTFKCAPPIRTRENQEQLWEGLAEGVIDFITSDHSPCTPELKQREKGDFMQAWGGIASLQFGVSSIWTHAQERGFKLQDIARWMSEKPREFLGLGESHLQPGVPANFVVFEPEETFTVEEETIYHRHKITPYAKKTLRGRVKKTFLRGQDIFNQNRFATELAGRQIFRTT